VSETNTVPAVGLASSEICPSKSLRAAKAPRLNLLEVARGVAACGVLAHHLDLLLQEPRYLGRQVWSGLLFPGYHGVDFFFVLSGFIITYAHWSDIGKTGRLRTYAARRVTRIVPAYWIVTTLLVAVYLLFPYLGKPHQHDYWNIAASYLLLPVSQPPVLGVAWTLRYEAVFYLAFALVIWRPRFTFPLCGLWLLGALVAHEPRVQQVSVWSLHNAQFILGMLACIWVKRYDTKHPVRVAAFGCLLLIVLYGLEAMFAPHFVGEGIAYRYRDSLDTICYGLASAIAIVGLARMDLNGHAARLPWGMNTLGAASYSIYLTHGALLSFIATGLFRFQLTPYLGLSGTMFTMALGALIGGVLFWRWVESPLHKRFRAALV
jgi:exopolysaccharide production protein ExoZ